MYSVAMPSSPAFLTISSFIASPTPCCPFPPLTMLQSRLKKTRYPDAEISEVPSLLVLGLLQSDDVTTLCITGSQQGVDVADTIDAVDRCCAIVKRAERKLLQPRPRPGGLVFLAGGLPLRPLPLSLFLSKCPSPFHSIPGVSYPGSCLRFSDVLGAAISPTTRSTSPSLTLLLTRVCPPSIPPLLASGPTFSTTRKRIRTRIK